MTFLACASGFGSRNLLFVARRALHLGMSSSSSRSLTDRVIWRCGGDERMGCDRGFLKVLMKLSTGIDPSDATEEPCPAIPDSPEPAAGIGEETIVST
jgi:hypothetical protein